ncbi:hypothetical protein [uncultured Mobiluncus sp.]|uniref:variant leucine-rich repeat-containing protein n=1 Tax=uncultured Mobiluncus sp. TaxID=293425 RepID=UPI0026093FF0|nr:hypothetical protein [uncultured Mobiluncus sp.]
MISISEIKAGALMEELSKEQLEAINPDTPLARLQTIAQDAPELGPLLALNPSTYPDLLDWLGELQDTQVNAALAKRAELVQRGELENYVTEYMASAKPVSKPPVHPEPQVSQPSKPATDPEPQVSPPSKPATDPQPKTSQPKEPPVSEEPQPSEKPASPVVKNSQPTANELELYQDGSTSAATAAAKMAAINRARTAAPRDYLASYPAAPALSTTEKIGARLSSPARTARHRFNRFWFWIIVGLLIWLVVIVLAVWGLTSQAEKPVSLNANAAEPTPSVSATPQELVQTSLPEGYTGPTKIIEVPGPHPGQTIKQVVPDDSASASASPTPTPTPTNPLAPPANAKKLNSFTTADGNVRCIFGGSQVQCFANSTDPYYCSAQAPNSGYSDALYASHSRNHEYACIEPIDTATEGTLAANETVTNGIFACHASKSGNRVVCWNTTAGDGIVVGSDLAARFGKGKYIPPQWDK